MTGGVADNGCPPGSTVCDQFVTAPWPDVVLLAVLALCAAAAVACWLRKRSR